MDADLARTWQPGQVVLDLYEVLDVVRTGGMGLVHRVRHLGWDVELAVKAPRRELVGTAEGERRFAAEAESWVGLGAHPNTVSCVYVRRLGGLPRVFAEWVDGGDLAMAVRQRRIYREGNGLARVLDVAIQSAWGLGHAHESGLVHQDVKPANVLLGSDGAVKVTDFGLAGARAAAGERPVGAGGSVLVSCGGLTPAYCSPEQARAAAGAEVRLTRATDVWSWAVSVLELFAGGPPTRFGQAAAEAFAGYLADGPPEPGLPVMPAGVVALLERCFRVEPGERPSGMAEVAAELLAVYGEVVGPYPRVRPTAATLLADGLSNQALSMMDLGHQDRAEALWERALLADPRHPHAVYNRGLRRWRAGELTDTELLAEVADSADDHLLGLIHLERGDAGQARELLRAAARRQPSAEVRAALTRAEQLPPLREPVCLAGRAGAVALSADGRVVAAGERSGDGEDGAVLVWDLRTGALRHRLDGAVAVALSADGGVLAAGGHDGAVRVWDLREPVLLGRWAGHTGPVAAVAVSPDGGRVVTAGRDGAVRVWSAVGELVHTLEQPGSGSDAAVRVDGRVVVRWDRHTRRLRAWELDSGRLLRSFGVRGGQAVLSADGRVALVADRHELAVWRPESGELLRTVGRPVGWAEPVAVSGDGSRAVTAGLDGFRVWELPSGRCLRSLPTGRSEALALSADGGLAVSAGEGMVRVWEVPPGGPRAAWSYPRPRPAVELSDTAEAVAAAQDRADQLAERGKWSGAAAELRSAMALPGYERSPGLLAQWARLGRQGRPSGVLGARQVQQIEGRDQCALTADGRLVVSAGAGRSVDVWEVATGVRVRRLSGHGDSVRAVALDSAGEFAVTGCADGKVRVWDLADGECARVWDGHRGEVVAVAVRGRAVVSAGEDRTVRVWQLDRRQGRVLRGHGKRIRWVEFSPDGARVFSRDVAGMLWIWDVGGARTGWLRKVRGASSPKVLGGAVSGASQLAVSADGRTGLLSGPTATVLLWHPPTGDYLGVLAGAGSRVTALAISDRIGYSGDEDGTIWVWDLVEQRAMHPLTGHQGAVRQLVAHDRFLFSAGADGTVRVWDPVGGRCLRVLAGHAGAVGSVRVSGDGRTVVSSGADKTLRVWEVDWDYVFPDE
ncbi:protein kinase [Crossiella sp. CA-258035]|uniref:protein kinase domain-containing protein n=1 Tax=Crossiella sp. CA-258035 TaxID=2981138 RepID=UPI0024BC5390|nr:protein kinase [Crossiella sp. CA-258035]WHT22896.1 protein kinase [Crossiella sp. CA-258035]